MENPQNNSKGNSRSGFAAIIGAPNVGKSTLLNSLVGEKVAIVSPKPNTTRNRIAGIITKGDVQAIFIDTPGIHRAKEGLNLRMVNIAIAAISEVDIILLMVEAGNRTSGIEKFIADRAAETNAKRFLVINKIDRVAKGSLLPEIEERVQSMGPFDEVTPISALSGDGVDMIEKLVMGSLPFGPHYYSEDVFTDQPERFIAAEMIREQIIIMTQEEVPYASAVIVEEWDDRPERVLIRAKIYVESAGQKAIVIGHRGDMIKKIGAAARKSIEKMLGTKVYLDLFVSISPKWRRNDAMLNLLLPSGEKKSQV